MGLVVSSSVEDPTLAGDTATTATIWVPAPGRDSTWNLPCICIFLGQNDLVRRVLRSTANCLRSRCITQSSTAEGHRGGHPRLLQGVRNSMKSALSPETQCADALAQRYLCALPSRSAGSRVSMSEPDGMLDVTCNLGTTLADFFQLLFRRRPGAPLPLAFRQHR